MKGMESFQLAPLDLAAFVGYFVLLSIIGYMAGRRRKQHSDDYFLAGRSLPWYVVGCSFIASNISSEHFIGMIGAAFVYGICVALFEWGNIITFSILIWFFIPFLLSSRVYTTPEFMEKRFNVTLRQSFAIVTVITNVVAFLAAVLYGGGLAIQKLFDAPISRLTTPIASWFHSPDTLAAVLPTYNLWLAIIAVAVAAAIWAVYGGLSSVAWMDVLTVVIMLFGGILVTLLGLAALSPDGSIVEGFRVMIERNQAQSGIYAEVVRANAENIAHVSDYNRLSVLQPNTHVMVPWLGFIFVVFSVGIWYNVINQFMVQRVLGARSAWDARMGVVFAGYMKIIMPLLVVIPGLILFALYPEWMLLPEEERSTMADGGYVTLVQQVVPIGLRGLFLAALFGAIQSTVNSVLNSTSTLFTLDIYKRYILLSGRAPGERKDLREDASSERHLVFVGILTSIAVLFIAIGLAPFIQYMGTGLFEYIQTLYFFFAPPFAAVFLLGILFRRINGLGAATAVFGGFAFGILLKLVAPYLPEQLEWLQPFAIQAMVNWGFCVAVCIAVSLLTAPPMPEQVSDDLTVNWRRLNLTQGLGDHWYSSVVLWWGLFVGIIIVLVVVFS